MGLREVGLFGGKMPTDLEKQFFDTFEIQERCIFNCCKECEKCGCYHYPIITDWHYLELICALNKHNYENYQCCTLLIGQTVEKVKKDILAELIENLTNYELNTIKYNKFKHQVQAIFKGER